MVATGSKKMTGWGIGYAQCDITPTKGQTLMCGYGRERYAVGVHKPLRAQALALRDADGKMALLITADLLGFDRLTVEYLRRRLAQSRGLEPQSVMLSATHTHWGPPALYRITFSVGPMDPWFVASLERKLLDMAEAALDDLKPGTLTYGMIETRIGHNRRLPLADGMIGFAINTAGHYDLHTPILRLSRRSGKGNVRDIVLVTHACHPTSSGGIDKYTTDYPGAMREHIEQTLGAGTRAIFAMGCGANAKVTRSNPESGALEFAADPKHAAAAGRQLAAAVLTHLHEPAAARVSLPASILCRLAAGTLTMAAPLSRAQLEAIAFASDNRQNDVWWARQMLAYPDSRRKHPYEVQSWVLGDVLTIIALEGEVCSPLGPLARSQAKTEHAMVIAYANEVQGYIPSKSIVLEGGYEGESSHRAYFKPAPFTPRVESEFKAIVRQAIT